jgi:plastocyanin
MKRFLGHTAVLFASICLLLPATTFAAKKLPASSSQTYTVLVGLEQSNLGIGVMAYFPRSVTIHVGDTVHWMQNSNEIHTVTFPDGILVPDLLLPSAEVPGADPAVSPLVFAPAVVLQSPPSGSEFRGGIGGFANSGIMGREPGQVQEYDLTFVSEGTFGYFCVVHGSAMSGEVVVVGSDEAVASPNQAMAQGKKEMAEALSLVPGVIRDAAEQIVPPETNEDGTITHTVLLGYNEIVTASYGDVEIDLMQFFPNKLTVRPGDQVTFEMSPDNTAPHTATFLNGAEEPPLAVLVDGFLYLNSDVVFPAGGDVLTRTGVFSSGLMLPVPGTSYSLTIGDMKPGLEHFLCLLHDSSGMTGELMVVPRP